MGGELVPLFECPRGRERYDSDGTLRVVGCWTMSCGWCGPWQMLCLAVAIGMARPSALVTITRVGTGFASHQRLMAGATDRHRYRGRDYRHLWVVEQGVSNAEHLHVMVRGHASYDCFASAIRSNGFEVGPNTIKISPSTRAAYPIRDYLLKPVRFERGSIDAQLALEQHLRLNNGRHSHQARDFFAVRGEPRTKAEALRLVRRTSWPT